jgi:hypothetical protein
MTSGCWPQSGLSSYLSDRKGKVAEALEQDGRSFLLCWVASALLAKLWRQAQRRRKKLFAVASPSICVYWLISGAKNN